MVPELDLQRMLKSANDPLPSSRSFGGANPSLGQLLGGGSLNGSDQNQYNQSMDSFRQMLRPDENGSRFSDAVNYPNDLTRQPLNPVTTSPSFGGNSLTRSPAAPGPSMPPSLSLPGFGSGFDNGAGANAAFPTINQSEERSRRLYSPPAEAPRRKF